MHESESEVAQSCLTLSDPMDCSLPGSSVLTFINLTSKVVLFNHFVMDPLKMNPFFLPIGKKKCMLTENLLTTLDKSEWPIVRTRLKITTYR